MFKMVYVVYSSNNLFKGAYEDENEATMICNSMNLDYEYEWKVVDLIYYKKESSQFHYSEEEEDPEYDETYYIDKINSLTNDIISEKKKFKILEEFTDFFVLLLCISTMYSCIILYVFM